MLAEHNRQVCILELDKEKKVGTHSISVGSFGWMGVYPKYDSIL